MRTAYIMAGTCGAFYCQTCLRDLALSEALTALDHAVQLVPLYLPLTADDLDAGDRMPRFFGGLNVYLQQNLPGFRLLPRWATAWLDAPRLLRWAGKQTELTTAADLGRTTVSMLLGEHGRQRAELERLAGWLRDEVRPEAVVLSSSLLVGLAGRIRQLCNCPLLCFLQDEDGFLDDLPPPWQAQAWALLRQHLDQVDRFLAPTAWYRAAMARRLGLAEDRIAVVPPGLDPAGYVPASPPAVPTIGFLAPAIPEKGLDRLCASVGRLRRHPGLAGLRLRVAGGCTAGSQPFLAQVQARLQAEHLQESVEFLGNPSGPAKTAFLASLTVLCVPERRAEAAGLHLLEANAAGLPAVVPACGGAMELLTATGGGLSYPPEDESALDQAMTTLLLEPGRAAALGRAGRQVVLDRFTAAAAAQAWLAAVAQVGQNPS